MDKKGETGRHLRSRQVIQDAAFHRQQFEREHERAITEFPQEAAAVQRLIAGMQLETIRDMYRNINARSLGRQTVQASERALRELHERVTAAPTNEITAKNVLCTVFRNSAGDLLENPAAQYGDLPNVIRINLGSRYFRDLAAFAARTDLSAEEHSAKLETVVNAYQLLFHELGHAYGYVSVHAHQADDAFYQKVQHGTHQVRGKTVPDDGGNTETTHTLRDGTFWLEGWNDLQASMFMLTYLQSHSLRYDDITLTRSTPGMERLVAYKFFDSEYGHASYAIWAIADHVAEHVGVPLEVVLNGFTKTFQTKRGRHDLFTVLEEILGPSIVDRISGTDIKTMDAKILSHDIMEKIKAPGHWIETLLEIITSPNAL